MIKVESLTKRYGKHIVINSINLEINPGDCIGIVGANGCGKTTLLSILGGIQKQDSGKILIDGEVLDHNSALSRSISYVPQDNPLINELTGRDNLRLWYKGNRLSFNKKLNEGYLRTLGIDDYIDKTVSKMSGGMKKRLSIGIALLSDPTVLIMDEPSAALDITGKYQIKNYMKYFTHDLKGSIVVASHDQNELSLCNKLYLLKNGELKAISSKINDDALMKII